MIRKSAADFVKGHSTIERVREMLGDEKGYSPELYTQMAESGWLGCVFPEDAGGIDLGYVDLVCIQEELGKGLIPEPLLTSAVLGGNCIFLGGNDAQKGDLLGQVIGGELTLTLGAYELDGRFDLNHVGTEAKADGSDYVLNGTKSFVSQAQNADKIIVSARTSGDTSDSDGITLFIVDAGTAGVSIQSVSTVDHRPRAMVKLENVKVGGDAVLGEVGKGLAILENAIDRAIVALCAEMLGGMETVLQMSVAYSKERVQFDRPIGSFQAIKHKAANMYTELETAKSAVYYAAMALDDDMPDAKAAVSCAKALCSDSYVHLTQEAIQIHGGIGFTDEHDAQLYYKRALASSVTFGDAAYHRDRYATEKGF